MIKENYFQACQSIATELQNNNNLSFKEILKIVKFISLQYQLNTVPKNRDILKYLPYDCFYRDILLVKPTKTASGVAVIAVMPQPYHCPHGRCIYCPGGLEYNTPMSYIGTEPSTKLAQSVNYDPYHQVKSKLDHLRQLGHNISKIELVIVGGTFPFMPETYQKEFVRLCFDALNEDTSSNLEESINKNQNSKIRCVGFTVETKPDYCKQRHIDLMLDIGVTRVELGVQTIDDNVYKLVNRGHTVAEVKESFQISRDAGYKIVAHMMPGLPGSSLEQDLLSFKTLIEDPAFKPDMLKIYPTLVLRDTGLYKLHLTNKYTPYSTEDLLNLLVEVKKIVPPWIRIMRIQREIEASDIIAGPKQGNIRQLIRHKLKELGIQCKCIRCREVGLRNIRSFDQEFVLNRMDYIASGKKEIFLSIESQDQKLILGFLRLRNLSYSHRKELQDIDNGIARDTAIVRELHVYGRVVDIGKRNSSISSQHQGFGFKLMKEAEKIARDEFNARKISVLSAVGTRQYYKKIGYFQNGPYVTKLLE